MRDYRRGNPAYSNQKHGFEVLLSWRWPFIRIVKYAIWGRLGKGGWANSR